MKPHRLCSRIWGLKLHTRHFSSSSTWGHWLSTLCSILLSPDLQLCESPSTPPVSKEQMYIGFAVSAVSQICTFYCHIILKNLRSPDGKGWIPDSIWVSLQLYHMCKLYDWIVSVDWIQYCHTDLDRLSVSWSCSLHHDCLGPSEAQTLENGTFWIDCILPIFCTGLSIHDSAPQHRRNMSLQQKSMIKELWSVYISFYVDHVLS